MARNNHTAEQIEAIAKELIEAAQSLTTIATAMRENDLEHALIHGTMSQKTHLPALVNWIDKACFDIGVQIKAKNAKIPSIAGIIKEKAAKQKSKSGKKRPI